MEKLSFEEKIKSFYLSELMKNDIDICCVQIRNQYENVSSEEKTELELGIMKNIHTYRDFSAKLYMSSFMYELTRNDCWFDMMLETVIENVTGYFTWDIMFQIFGQLNSKMFVNARLQTNQRKVILARIYRKIIDDMKNTIGLRLNRVPVKERNKDLVVVMTSQFLSIEHGPTKTALDRCSTLVRKENKKVLLINSGELLNVKNLIPFYSLDMGSYFDGLLEKDSVEYQGMTIPYYQCKHDMPCVAGMIEIMNLIDELRPLYIIHIGGGSPLCEYCDDIVPVVSIGTVPSEVGISATSLQVMGRQLKDEDSAIIQALGKEEKDIIVGRFTSSIPMAKATTSRKELGLPEDKFLCIVVGARLDSEITDEFVRMMMSVGENVVFVFAGRFDDKYNYYVDKYKGFEDIAINLGFTKNMMGVYAQCDLYVNPIRQGGGTSVVEAMYEGLPAVSVNYGDVSLGCGEEFLVDDYDSMIEKIRCYSIDKELYNKASLNARDRAKEMLDSDKAFCEIIRSVEGEII